MGQYKIRLDNLIGSVIQVEDMNSKLHFVSEARKKANQYEWLYQCTNKEALLNIIQNKKFWLTNLMLVNDTEESERINDPEYEKSFFIASFTYEDNILPGHWEEYGNQANGVLFGVKSEWFMNEIMFMTSENQELTDEHFKVYPSYNAAFDAKLNNQYNKNKIIRPYEAFDFGFYQVVYDDDLMKSIQSSAVLLHDGVEIYGRFMSPEIAGIIKHTKGISRREGQQPKERNWVDEKEVRLKIGIKNQYTPFQEQKNLWFRKLSVSLTHDAFNELVIRFSPEFIEKDKKSYIEKLITLLPNTNIKILGNG
jgi:hypothetical protein